MRKIWIALACAVVAALSVAAVASAVNTYEVDIAKATKGKGSKKKPKPAQLAFGYEVDDTEDLRPEVIRQYRIAAEGLQSFPGARPDCTFEQATDPTVTDPSQLSRACRRAFVGDGTISNEAGAPNARSEKLVCDVDLTLINIRDGDPRYPKTQRAIRRNGGIAIRIDTYPPEGSRCPIPVHEALAAPFYDVRIQGVPTSELRFTVPDTLAHPGGLDNSVVDVTSNVDKKKGKARVRGTRRTVGFYSLVGRKGRTRTIRVTFVDESGAKFTSTRTMGTTR
jgi:hypothetical protein